ncbi:MAG TPA: HAMP domain-containing protein, partial [Acidimicrobiales bacterium]|nr:HAMP domain-containing protein [Acidimicrobiales bacterium]
MKRRLLASYLVLVLVVLILLEVPLGALIANHDESVLAAQAEQEATGLAIVVGEGLEHHEPGQVRSLVSQYRDRTGGEVTVYGLGGRVLATAGTDHDHDARPDAGALVSRALAGHPSSSFSFDEGHPVAEAAVPLSVDTRSPGAVLLDVPAGSAVTSAHEAWLVLALFGAGALAASVLVALALARSFSRPLGDLERSAERLGRGDLAARSSENGPDEIRSLASEFNRMAQQLEELVGAQNRFVADASHQLRSPLTALRLRLENLEPDVGGRVAVGVAAAVEEVQRLSRIVDGLLALTRAGSEHPSREMVDVARIIEQR